MLITSTREHEIHAFDVSYARMQMFEKCIHLARLYDKPFDYESIDILWSEDRGLRARELVLSEPINSPGWKMTVTWRCLDVDPPE